MSRTNQTPRQWKEMKMQPVERLKELLGKRNATNHGINWLHLGFDESLKNKDFDILEAWNGDWGLNILNIITGGVYTPGDLGQACRTAINDLNAIGKPEKGVDWWALLKANSCLHWGTIEYLDGTTLVALDGSCCTRGDTLQDCAHQACEHYGIEPEG